MAKKAGRKSTKATFIFSHKIFILICLDDVVRCRSPLSNFVSTNICMNVLWVVLCYVSLFSVRTIFIFCLVSFVFFVYWTTFTAQCTHTHTRARALSSYNFFVAQKHNIQIVWFLGRRRDAMQTGGGKLNNTYWIILIVKKIKSLMKW